MWDESLDLAGNSPSTSKKRINSLSLELTLCHPCEHVPPALDLDFSVLVDCGWLQERRQTKRTVY